MKRPGSQTSLAGLLIAVAVVAIGLAYAVNHVGTREARCKILYYGEVDKVGVRGPIQIDIDQDSHCALIVNESFDQRGDFPLQIGMDAEQMKSVSAQLPMNGTFSIRYRPQPFWGLPADDPHGKVVYYLRRYEPTLRSRPMKRPQ